jgi:hypothetical protein
MVFAGTPKALNSEASGRKRSERTLGCVIKEYEKP